MSQSSKLSGIKDQKEALQSSLHQSTSKKKYQGQKRLYRAIQKIKVSGVGPSLKALFTKLTVSYILASEVSNVSNRSLSTSAFIHKVPRTAKILAIPRCLRC